MTGTLVTDKAEVALTVQTLLDEGTPPRQLGLRIPNNHRITPSEISTVNRAVIRFEA